MCGASAGCGPTLYRPRPGHGYNRRSFFTGTDVLQFIQLVISGISQGCIYGLIALGFVLIYKATETVSFAQGELMMLGAFCGLGAMTFVGFPYWLAVVCAIAGMGIFGMALERLVIRPILGQPAFSVVMLTIGIGYVA